jgi:ketosteroid isomerase-like protein
MTGRARSPIAGCLSLMLLCLAGSAQSRRTAADEVVRILALETIWNEAEVKHDARALSMVLADAFEYTDSDGSFMDRKEWLSHVTSEVDQYEQLGNSGMKVHMYGDVAIVNGQYQERLKIKGKSTIRTGRFTDTWILQKDEWKCVASQSTLISP